MKRINVFLVLAAALALLGGVFAACQMDTAPRYTVTFSDPSGGNTFSPVIVEEGSSLGSKLPTNVIHKTGPFIFYGWFDGASQYFADTPIGRNITLTARYSDDIATVSFAFTQTDAGGNIIEPTATIPSVTAIKGLTLGTSYPVAPRSKGWAFDGWLLDDGEKFTTDTPVPGDITLKASWVAKALFTVTFNSGPGGASVSPIQVYTNECIDEWEVRFPARFTENTVNPEAFFVDWFDNENRMYDGRVPITRNVTLTAKWGMPPYIIDFDRDVEEVQNHDGSEGISFEAIVRDAWDSTPENPKRVIVNERMYGISENTNRWRILYRIKLKMPDEFDVGFYTRYTIRARFYANEQGAKSWTDTTAFTPNNPADEWGYSEAGLLHGVSSQSDDGWGQISWISVPNWNGQGADAETMLQRYNLDRKGGTINDTWAPLRGSELKYPPYLLIQTSDNYIGHIEVYQIVFHNGEWEHTAYEGEERPSTGTEE